MVVGLQSLLVELRLAILISLNQKRKIIKMDATAKNVENSTHTQSLTKKMEPSFATNVESDGEFSSIASDIEAEVQAAANELTIEMLMLLIDKWEAEVEHKRKWGKLNMNDMLNHYVRLKISLHHVKRHYERGWSACDPSDAVLRQRIGNLIKKADEARRNYYVAKRRYEGEHGDDCSCRGCRCLKGVSSRRSF